MIESNFQLQKLFIYEIFISIILKIIMLKLHYYKANFLIY